MEKEAVERMMTPAQKPRVKKTNKDLDEVNRLPSFPCFRSSAQKKRQGNEEHGENEKSERERKRQ